jgi:hypothetical protein
VYWVEIRSPGSPDQITWIRSNPIYVRGPAATMGLPTRPPPTASRPFLAGDRASRCRAEHDPSSVAAVEASSTTPGELRFRFGLSGGSAARPVAALVCDEPDGLAPYDRLAFTVRADRPMRLSVQLRGGEGEATGDRWQRSVYVGTVDQERPVYFDDLMPVGATHTFKAPLPAIRAILFVVDQTNTKPGTSGTIWIKRAALQTRDARDVRTVRRR